MTALQDQHARERIRTSLDETLFVEAGAGSGKTRSLVDRVVALVDAGVRMERIATITFTEKAAAELRHRLRAALEARRDDPNATEVARERARTALTALDVAAVSTLHAFAQRILSENPIEAALPPAVEVLDEVASELAFEDRWRRFRDRMLDDPALERTLMLAFASGISLDQLRNLARVFDDNWDLVADPERIPWPAEEPPEVDVADLLDAGEAVLRRLDECSDPDDLLAKHLLERVGPHLARLARADDEYERLALLLDKTGYRCSRGRKPNWVSKESVLADLKALSEQREQLCRRLVQSVLQRLAVEIAGFTLEAARERRRHGRLEFHDLLVLARDLLRGPHGSEVRARLAARYERLLLDEFQDTDPIQIDLAVLIAADPAAGDVRATAWEDVPVTPGRLFFVGDPKQSIYRFRRADIALFLRARERFGPPVQLSTNFRTAPAVLEWVNAVFGELITGAEDSQPEYVPLAPAPERGDPPKGPAVMTLGVEPHEDSPSAEVLREREAAEVADAVLAARSWWVSERAGDGTESWRPARLGDITILLPARTSLPQLERALEERAIPYRAETSSLVYATREVRELMAAVTALADPTDQLALVTALRSPLFGCGDDDLYTYRHGGSSRGAWNLLADPPEGLDPDHPVVAALRYLREVHQDLPWLTPAEVLDRVARERRLFELGYALGHPRDLWRRLRFVIDHARAWSEAEGGTLREYVEWARMQASESSRVAETVLPETDDDSVRIMTIHGAKGLEFPITILSGMTTQAAGRRGGVQAKFPPQGPVALSFGKDLITDEFEAFQPIDEQMDEHERLRLLYVACTRAKDHLVVSLHRKPRNGKPTNAELIARACEGLPAARLESAPPLPALAADHAATAMPSLEEWEDARAAVLAQSARPRSIGASDVAATTVEAVVATADEVDEDVAAGAEKSPRDLELPPWQKGRYGTAIGRAVHGVLQTIDLATGAGLAEAAAGQAAAEGVLGREDEVARLARDALASPAVREAARHQRWRETYVATQVGGRTLEGYIDLLYRTPDGLVVVDYKTAASAADLDRRMAAYRGQGGAYAAALEAATGERVARVVFLFLTPDGPVERELDDLDAAKAAVLETVGV